MMFSILAVSIISTRHDGNIRVWFCGSLSQTKLGLLQSQPSPFTARHVPIASLSLHLYFCIYTVLMLGQGIGVTKANPIQREGIAKKTQTTHIPLFPWSILWYNCTNTNSDKNRSREHKACGRSREAGAQQL